MCIHQILAHITFHICISTMCFVIISAGENFFHVQYYRITKMYSNALRMQSQSKDGIALPMIGQLEANAIAHNSCMAISC